MTVVRGATWEDEFTYTDAAGVPINLTGYEARLQVRTPDGRFGTTTTTTLVMEATTLNGKLIWDTAVLGRLRISVAAADTTTLNPSNLKRRKLAYALEVYRPAGASPEYVIPLVEGSILVKGETVR